MITLDQVLLLEEKVESAVAKIAQLEAENDALRTKCSELSNSLSEKSELLSGFEKDQSKIESGILKALDRLNSIENSVLKVAAANKNASGLKTHAESVQTKTEIHSETVQSSSANTSAQNQADASGQFDIF